MSCFIKLNKNTILTKFDNEASGFTQDMFKKRDKYIEIPVAEVKDMETSKKQNGIKETKILVKPAMRGIFFNRFPPYGELAGHTILLTINPLLAMYANKPQLFLLEEEDVAKMGEFVITYKSQQGRRRITTDDWMYRIYGIN